MKQSAIMPETIADRIKAIRGRIDAAARRCGRNPNDVRLVAVGKTKPAAMLSEAAAAGATVIGENYIQEAREKFDALIDLPIQWHFIGHLQSNKAKYAVRIFDLIHTVDSEKLAREIDKQAAKAGKKQKVLVQVNISGESTKSGTSRNDAFELVEAVSTMPNLELKGLMTMPPFFDAPERARPFFAALRSLRDDILKTYGDRLDLGELSMGMTGDFEVAVEEGATLVRIGTALFGARS